MRVTRIAATLVALTGLCASPALARDFAPVDRAGPPLSVPEATLAKALVCQPAASASAKETVLLVPGTTLRPSENFSWNYERALAAHAIPYCTIELPEAATADVQVAGEYVAYAIRRTNAISGKKVQVLGFSQGGMVPRWALRFWPDTRALVDDVIGLDPSNHGTLTAEFCTAAKSCPAAFWQQRASAAFIGALNSFKETFAGISYSSIYSRTDEVVTPNLDSSGSSSLRPGDGRIANVAAQEICPADTSEHLAMGSYDAVGYALALDALTHDGPADAARIPATVCAQPFHEGVDPSTFATDYAAYLGAVGANTRAARQVTAEPPLACYVYADCPIASTKVAGQKQRSATKKKAKAKARKHSKRRRHLRRSRAFTG